jgi:hypothetical protein
MSEPTDTASLRERLGKPVLDERFARQLELAEALKAAIAAGDKQRQIELANQIAANTREVKTVLTARRGAMMTAIDRARTTSNDEERANRLCEAFAICAETQALTLDRFGGGAIVDQAIDHKHIIAAELDAIRPAGRSVLARLLVHSDPNVRASAAAHLLNGGLMRDQVIPILQDIERREGGCAGWTAFGALSPHDHGAWLTGEAGARKG